MTQSQLTELFESDQIKGLIARSEERGWVDPIELEAFVLEHELNDEEAEQIAYNGKLWMMDLVYHTDVKKDTEEIMDETFRRYLKHFVFLVQNF